MIVLQDREGNERAGPCNVSTRPVRWLQREWGPHRKLVCAKILSASLDGEVCKAWRLPAELLRAHG